MLYTTHSLKQCRTNTHSFFEGKKKHIQTREEKCSNAKAYHKLHSKVIVTFYFSLQKLRALDVLKNCQYNKMYF